MDPLETVELDGPEKFTYVSALLSIEEKEHLQCVLLGNIYVFAWNHLDMTENRLDAGLSQTECYPLGKTCEIESKAFPSGSPSDYSNRGRQSSKSRFHERGKVS